MTAFQEEFKLLKKGKDSRVHDYLIHIYLLFGVSIILCTPLCVNNAKQACILNRYFVE